MVIDGFESYLSYKFYHYAQADKIKLFQLPPYSIYLTQLLDIGCFKHFKYHHAERLNKTVQNSKVDFNKLDFLSIFRHMYEKTFIRSTILCV